MPPASSRAPNWLGNTLLQDSGQGTLFLARLDADGNTVWVQTVSAANGSFVPLNCLAADPSGNVTLAGYINSSAVIGGSNLTVSGQTGFLAQFNAGGTLNWAEVLSSPVQCLQYGGGNLYASLINWIGVNTNYTVGGLTNAMDRNWDAGRHQHHQRDGNLAARRRRGHRGGSLVCD